MPQLEDGHLRIANELYDAIWRFGFSKRQLHVMAAIIRKTYGYSKKVDDMTVQQIANWCGMDRGNVSRTLSELVAINAVSKQHGKYGYVLGINKNYGEWGAVSKQHACQNNTDTVSKQHGGRVKTTRTIDNPQQTTPTEAQMSQIAPRKQCAPFSAFWDVWPKKLDKHKAAKAWTKLSPDEELASTIIKAVECQRSNPDWKKDGGQFIPYPATWLNARRWEDETATPIQRSVIDLEALR